MSGASLGSLERVPTWDKSAPTDFFAMGEESGVNRREYICTRFTGSSSSMSSLSLSWLRSEPLNPEDMLGKNIGFERDSCRYEIGTITRDSR